MPMACGQQALGPRAYPLLLRLVLALGAMAVTARVIDRMLKSTPGAHVEVAAQCGGPTERDGRQGSTLANVESHLPL